MDTTTMMTANAEGALIDITLAKEPEPTDRLLTIDGGCGWQAWLTAGGRVYQQRDAKRVRRVRFGALPGLLKLVARQSDVVYAEMESRRA